MRGGGVSDRRVFGDRRIVRQARVHRQEGSETGEVGRQEGGQTGEVGRQEDGQTGEVGRQECGQTGDGLATLKNNNYINNIIFITFLSHLNCIKKYL